MRESLGDLTVLLLILVINLTSYFGNASPVLAASVQPFSPSLLTESKRELSQFLQVNTTVYWDGGEAVCNQCVAPLEYWNGSFACNFNGQGDWSDGEKDFQDPLPEGSYLVHSVSVELGGQFNCHGHSTPPAVTVRLGSTPVASLSPAGGECLCPHCLRRLPAHSPAFPLWPDYRYGRLNRLSLALPPNTTLCLSWIRIQLNYSADGVNPTVFALLPPGGTVEGGAKVSAFGNGFSASVGYGCVFGDLPPVDAEFKDESHIICRAPPFPQGGTVPFGVYIQPNNQTIPTSQTFVYYGTSYLFLIAVEPNITELIPSSGGCDSKSNITIRGEGFINLPSMRCQWNSITTFGSFINSSHVSCQTPEAEGPMMVEFSENGNEFTRGLPFLCSSRPTPPVPASFEIPGWVWVVSVFGASTIVAIIIVFATKKCRQRGDDEELGERQNLLGDSLFTKQIDINDVKLGPRIGKGTFGEVFKGTWNGTVVGVKFLTSPTMNEQFLQDFYKEVSIMRSLRHPNVLQFLGACTSPPDVCIVMEYMPLGSLFKILHDDTISITFSVIRRMMLDAARGMNYLHKSDPVIIHRDLKSHNLLVDENWKVKVCDFGLSKILETQSDFTTMTACGTPSWTAPEILRNEMYTEKADIYSYGIVLWECITREDPYEGMPPFQVVLAVGTKQMRPVIPESCPPQWRTLVTETWAEDPKARPSFDEIMERLESIEATS